MYIFVQKVYVAKDPHDKALQRALLNYWVPEKRALVVEALRKAGRQDLIGTAQHCLVNDIKVPKKQGFSQQKSPAMREKEKQYASTKKRRR